MSDKIEIIKGTAEEVELPEKVDIMFVTVCHCCGASAVSSVLTCHVSRIAVSVSGWVMPCCMRPCFRRCSSFATST
jgi:hypothetical protein